MKESWSPRFIFYHIIYSENYAECVNSITIPQIGFVRKEISSFVKNCINSRSARTRTHFPKKPISLDLFLLFRAIWIFLQKSLSLDYLDTTSSGELLLSSITQTKGRLNINECCRYCKMYRYWDTNSIFLAYYELGKLFQLLYRLESF